MRIAVLLSLLSRAAGLSALSSPVAALESRLLSLAATASTPASELEAVVAELIESSGGGIERPALSPLIEGDWRLAYTTKSDFDARNPLGRRSDQTVPGLESLFPGAADAIAAASSSPIQRAVTAAFPVTQSLYKLGSEGRVEQSVNTPLGELNLNAAASVSAASPRRVSFAFDEGYLLLRGGVRLPYPVPFRLLGKEAEGWLDTDYLSERVRISTGNKGTTFVLERMVS